jgi:hypothetical protein
MIDRRIVTTRGAECVLSSAVIDKLGSNLRGDLIASGDQDYDAARKVWNGMVDKRPALIARCAEAADVVSCVRFARGARCSDFGARRRTQCWRTRGLRKGSYDRPLADEGNPDRFHRTDGIRRARFAARRIR